jgi:phosphate:Na+ symporter
MDGIHMREEKIDFLEEKDSRLPFSPCPRRIERRQAMEVYGMMSIANDLESIADIIHRNIVPLMEKKKGTGRWIFPRRARRRSSSTTVKVCQQIKNLEQPSSRT